MSALAVSPPSPSRRVANILLASALAPGAAVAQVPDAAASLALPGAVAVIVKVPAPWYAPKAVIAGRMRDTVPQYEQLPGLSYKVYTLAQADGQFGGIYLWQDAAAAKRWFSPAWFERVEKERGTRGDVRYFDVPVAIDNTAGGTPRDLASDGVATLVTIATPPGVGRERLVKEFEAAVPLYRTVPGLLRKYFVVAADNRFGGIYVWKDAASARRWFDDAWKERVRKTYGSDAALEWFDTPILLPAKAAPA